LYDCKSVLSRFSIRISSLRALRLERGKRVGGEYMLITSIITAKAFRLKAKVLNLVNGKIKYSDFIHSVE